MSQVDLADKVGISAASVSGWVGDRKPPKAENVKAIASALNVDPGWLQFGTGEEPGRDPAEQRAEYRKRLKWYWQPPPPDRQRVMGDPAGHAFEVRPRSLVRETGQNTLDELMDGEQTVELEFTVIDVEGDETKRFLDTLRYDPDLRDHLKASAIEAQRKHAAVIDSGLTKLENDGRLRMIRIADYGANGLTGPEFEEGRFMAVCRNTLDSFKGSEAAGGSYGLGKATMWTASWMGIVITNSKLSIPEGEIKDNRIFVRAELPWHKTKDGESHNGPGWFGRYDEEAGCAVSYGGNETLARDLYVDRSRNGLPGTTFLVVGAYDPSGEEEDDLDFLAESLREHIAENFWAAMVPREDQKPRLRAVVRTQRGAKQLSEHVVDPTDHMQPMAETLGKFYADDLADELSEPGDVISRKVSLSIPARLGLDPHDAFEHEATLLVAYTDLHADSKAINRVTFLRGNNMTIKDFVLQPLPLGAHQFHAVLLAGEAAGQDAEHRRAEKFFRAAEPPAHDKWIGTSELTTRYKRGGAVALKEFERSIKGEIREAIRDKGGGGEEGPEPLKELLRLTTLPETQRKPRIKKLEPKLDEQTGAWSIKGVVSVPSGSRWSFLPALRFGTESGPAIGIDWETLEAEERCRKVGGRLVTDAGARTVGFRAVSDPKSYPVKAGRARARVDLRHVRKVAEEAS
jgi:RNA polymerase primary sigma factor